MAETLWVSSQLAGCLGSGIAVNPTTLRGALWILVRPLASNRASAVVAFGRHHPWLLEGEKMAVLCRGGCQREIEDSPEPGPPITVGLDGGYIRGRERRPGGTGCFEVIAGKSIPEEGQSKVFAGVGQIDTKPKRRLHEVLKSQGVLPRQHVTFLSDGGDTVRSLPSYLHPHSENILDWFHIGMRVEQLSQAARGFRGTDDCLMTKEK